MKIISPESEARKKARAAAERERVRRMAKVLESPEGEAAITDILLELGLGRPAQSPEEIVASRAAHALLARARAASPRAAANILAKIFRLEGE